MAAPTTFQEYPSTNHHNCTANTPLLCFACYAVQDADCYFPLPSPVLPPKGATMNVSFSYKHVEAQQPVVSELARRVGKLEKLLKAYQPDLLQLKGMFSQNPHTEEQSLALTLSLPTGKLHATGNGKNMLAACKKAFSEIEAQLKKHQSLLRHEHEWKRKRPELESL
jgi:ribosomal subunit interface protein